MSENKRSLKLKRVALNVVYSFLVYCVSFYIFAMILDRSVFTNHPSLGIQLKAQDFLAVALSVAVAVAFFVWFKKRGIRE